MLSCSSSKNRGARQRYELLFGDPDHYSPTGAGATKVRPPDMCKSSLPEDTAALDHSKGEHRHREREKMAPPVFVPQEYPIRFLDVAVLDTCPSG